MQSETRRILRNMRRVRRFPTNTCPASRHAALIAESADVLYHLLLLWEDAGVATGEVWAELERREGISGIAEKASRNLPERLTLTRKIP